ncbi:MAG TPA: glycerophosphodiester phosphodiesterase [Candidatus Dojkabacteria bacterium]|nr:glycerophosphodiester phosphodiesterase [Candidatus Dojkabacteria bacterium]
MNSKILIAHRGANRIFTENTLEAILEAYRWGATHAEIDVHRTKDNKLIVFHDPVTTRFDGKIQLVKNVESEYFLNLKMPIITWDFYK